MSIENGREQIRKIVLSEADEARLSAYREKLQSQPGWTEAAITNEVGLLKLSLQRAAWGAARENQAKVTEFDLRDVRIADGLALDEARIRDFGVAPVVPSTKDAKIKVSQRLSGEFSESKSALAMSSSEMFANIGEGKRNPRLHTVWGIVHHPEHGLLAVTAAEFRALDLPEYVPAV